MTEEKIRSILQTSSMPPEDVVTAAAPLHEDKTIKVIQWMVDNNSIQINADGMLELMEK